mgnify:FL=1
MRNFTNEIMDFSSEYFKQTMLFRHIKGYRFRRGQGGSVFGHSFFYCYSLDLQIYLKYRKTVICISPQITAHPQLNHFVRLESLQNCATHRNAGTNKDNHQIDPIA